MTNRQRAPFLFVVLLSLTAAFTAAADVPISEQARLHWEVGVGLLEGEPGPRYAEAYESFRAAYKASPSPKILSNLGLCAMHIERDGEAINAYETYLREVDDIPPAERSRIESDLKRLRAGSATLILTTPVTGALLVDERVPESGPSVINRYPLEAGENQLAVRAGAHKLRVEAPDHKPVAVAVTLEPGDTHARTIKLERASGKPAPEPDGTEPRPAQPKPAPRPQPPTEGGGVSAASIAMLTVTGALTIGAVVVGVLALKAKADYETYEDGGDRVDAESVRATGEALNIVTDVLIATAAAAAVVSVVLLFTTDGGDTAARLRVAPAVGGGTVALDLRF